MSQAQRGGFFPQGENLWVERAEHTRQDPEAQSSDRECSQAGHAGQDQERDVYYHCILSVVMHPLS